MGLGGRIAAAKYFLTIPGGAGGADGAGTTFNGSDEGRKKKPGNSLSLLSIVVIPSPPFGLHIPARFVFRLNLLNYRYYLVSALLRPPLSRACRLILKPSSAKGEGPCCRGPFLPRACNILVEYQSSAQLTERTAASFFLAVESHHSKVCIHVCIRMYLYTALALFCVVIVDFFGHWTWERQRWRSNFSFLVFCLTACYLNEFGREIIIYLWVVCKFPSPCLHGLLVQVSPLSPVVIILMTHCGLGLMRCQILSQISARPVPLLSACLVWIILPSVLKRRRIL